MLGKTEGKRPLGRLRVDGRIVLQCIFKKYDKRFGLDLAQDMGRWRNVVNKGYL